MNVNTKEMKITKFALLIFRTIRKKYYRTRYHLKFTHPSANILGKCKISKDVRIGKYAHVGKRCRICPNVEIQEYTMIAHDVFILGDDHVFNKIGIPVIFSGRPKEIRKTTIGMDVWIGTRAIIKSGVCIGDGAIIAAGSIVTRDIPAGVIVGGVPAKKIRMRFSDESELSKHLLEIKSEQFSKTYAERI